MFDHSYLNIVMFNTKGPFMNDFHGNGIDLELLIKVS